MAPFHRLSAKRVLFAGVAGEGGSPSLHSSLLDVTVLGDTSCFSSVSFGRVVLSRCLVSGSFWRFCYEVQSCE